MDNYALTIIKIFHFEDYNYHYFDIKNFNVVGSRSRSGSLPVPSGLYVFLGVAGVLPRCRHLHPSPLNGTILFESLALESNERRATRKESQL